MPNANERHSGGISLPKAASTIGKLAPDKAEADQHTGREISMPGVVE